MNQLLILKLGVYRKRNSTMKKEEAIEILNALAWVQGGADREETITAISMAIEALSADRPQGVWIWCGDKGDSRYMCSVCKVKQNVPTCMGEPTIWDYCPSCGARMENTK